MSDPTYDRELIARMLDEHANEECPSHTAGAIREQANLLRAADALNAAGVRTVNTTGAARALAERLFTALDDAVAANIKAGGGEFKPHAIRALEAALAQQPEAPAQEAVAWQSRYRTDGMPWSKWADWEIEGRDDPFPKYTGRWEREYRALYASPQPAIPEGWSFVRQDDGSIVARAEGYGAACVREGDNTSVAAGLLYLLAADLLAASHTQEPDHG